MDINSLILFFKWCSIINGLSYLASVILVLLAPDFIYRIQSKIIPIPRESFNIVMSCVFGIFEIFFIFFNLTPLIALYIIR
ncbi:MAG: hypothetical protein KAT46_07540 [Deltaproteobacteria bacterium]|nr:hypothetical protein [Deltaproteobacteria bacterium]